MTSTLLVLAGPSCAGKSPLVKALRSHYPDLAASFRSPVLYHSRKPRPGEEDGKDYHFRTRDEIKTLKDDDRFAVFKTRGELQALNRREFASLLSAGDVLYEGSVSIAQTLRKEATAREGVRVVDVFLSPLSLAEVQALGAHPSFGDQLVEMSRRRLLRRANGKAAQLGLPDLEDVEARAATVLDELAQAPAFGNVIPCGDGEDSDHWKLFPRPVGDAGRALAALAAILAGTPDGTVERWPLDTLSR
jgi:guanylate kinase